MPRIKAYKGSKGNIIPLDEAKIATVFRCPWTNKIFVTKSSYVQHLQHLRHDRMHTAIRHRIFQKQRNDLWSQPSFDAVISWVERHPEFFFDNASGYRGDGRQDRISTYRDKFWIKITYLDLQWSERLSNSHSCPRDGVTNWGGKDCFKDGTNKPIGYPGWEGHIEYQMSHDLGFGSDVMRGVSINTGTGGGINDNRYGHEVKFFESDWPGLRENNVLSKLTEDASWKRYKYGVPRYFR